jgi:hypothetical protein
LSIELVASLNVRPVFASNELLSVLTYFARHPMLYSFRDDSGSDGKPEGGAIPNSCTGIQVYNLEVFNQAGGS